MSDVRFYGRRIPEEAFAGRIGKVVRAFNKARMFTERMTEVAVVLYHARRDSLPLTPVVTRLVEEGLTVPGVENSQPPIGAGSILNLAPDTQPEFDTRFFEPRDYAKRVGKRLDKDREDRMRGIVLDDSFSIRGRGRNPRANRHGASPLIVERFEPVGRSK